jgi:hypothetical protein
MTRLLTNSAGIMKFIEIILMQNRLGSRHFHCIVTESPMVLMAGCAVLICFVAVSRPPWPPTTVVLIVGSSVRLGTSFLPLMKLLKATADELDYWEFKRRIMQRSDQYSP